MNIGTPMSDTARATTVRAIENIAVFRRDAASFARISTDLLQGVIALLVDALAIDQEYRDVTMFQTNDSIYSDSQNNYFKHNFDSNFL